MRKSAIITLCNTWLFVIFGLFTIVANAQNNANNSEERVIRQLLVDYYKALTDVDISKDKQSVLKYYHTTSDRTISQLSIQAGYRVYSENYNQYADFLDQSIQDYERDQVITNYSLGQIYSFSVIGDIAIVSFIANYEDKRANETFAKGKHDNTFTFKRIEDTWKIIKADIAWIEEQVLKGQCYCWLYENKGEANSYVLKVSSPQGSDKKSDLLQVRYTSNPSKGEKMFYLVDAKDTRFVYRWLDGSSFELSKIDDSGKVLKTLGKPKNEQETIGSILQYDIFEKNCVRVNIRK
ncbi:MAG: hypothetical protein NZ551_07560 [Microscillaceae bacterium]|nr:hypothetical protein [Microscillaceae bacterium]MDW8461052.1 hypothetical protein [Cytophagales bacterium]